MRSRLWAAVAVTGALVLTGCGTMPPGAAAVVDGHTISRSDVDTLSQAQCDGVELAVKHGQQQAQSRKQLTEQALSLLIDIRLNLDYAKSLGLTPRTAQTTADYAQVEPLIKALPAKYQSYLSDVFHDWAKGRDMMVQVGEQATGQVESSSNADQLLDAGYKKRQVWLDEHARIDTDARYSPGKVGWPGEGDGSVSRPVSSYAKGAAKSQPSAAFISGLPAGMRCG